MRSCPAPANMPPGQTLGDLGASKAPYVRSESAVAVVTVTVSVHVPELQALSSMAGCCLVHVQLQNSKVHIPSPLYLWPCLTADVKAVQGATRWKAPVSIVQFRADIVSKNSVSTWRYRVNPPTQQDT